MKKHEDRHEQNNAAWAGSMLALVKGGLFAAVLAIIFLFICAVMTSIGVLQERYLEGCVLTSCILGAMIGGVYVIKRARCNVLLAGIGEGGVLFLLLLTVGLLAFGSGEIKQNGVQICSACLCGGAIAGILGRKPKKKRKR